MARRLESTLRDYNIKLDAATFKELLVDIAHNLAPAWNDEELVHHPRVALHYCEEIRNKVDAPSLPDDVILRALSGIRKQSRRAA